MINLDVYADGSGTTAKTPAGYGWVLVKDGVKVAEGSGHMPTGTNNDAELAAAINGLLAATKLLDGQEYNVTLVSDSQIILGWASGEKDFKQVEKMDKYTALIGLMCLLKADTRWVKGHNGDEHQERCDVLANQARKQETK